MLRLFTLLTTLPLIVLTGTIFFRLVEGWSWLDAYFFTVVTLSTVGYGSLVPVTALGKIGTTIFIFTGLGVFALTIQQFAAFAMRKREQHTEKLMGITARGAVHESPSDAANTDESAPG
ncbi:potassium channel family protein [Roseovarius aestuarii]|uniref:Voltage-gated potassium channel n=1 Tax=Roseovarius aestuarii TaxID=475083 RepID=A0A1X7BYH1_9RHOB|nr:potassium channel family protein [Roseovarius aestuarii]SMC14633.1 voltage-gated potassium channel [Roseovarius aestuarii]